VNCTELKPAASRFNEGGKPMKTPKLYVGAIVVFCTIALIIGSAGAAATSGPDNSNFGNKTGHGGPVKMLDRFEEQGYDVSAIRAAVESGDNTTAHTLMQQFMEAHTELIPARNADKTNAPGFGAGMMEKHLTQLEEQGYDISAIRAAVESGDNTTAHTLMQEFMEAHTELIPARNADKTNAPGFGAGMMEKHLTQLEEQGYDVSAIRAAVESGDNVTAHTLMQQFMEAHKDELPQREAGQNRTLSRGVATK
jgi:DNA-binding GntR family transcriptional regulator